MKRLHNLLLVLFSLLILIFMGCSENDKSTNSGDEQPTSTYIISGTITQDTTFHADKTYILRGGVFIGDDINETVLTIEPGTVIKGESSTFGMLVIRRGSQIIADGSAADPIVFTSDKAAGSRNRGDWGGLIINGRAPLNTGGEAFGEGGTGYYGGTVVNDNSGILRYVRVEFAGREISPDNELNGIAFQGVGNGTTVEYVQVHKNKDDGIEFFGGTVNAKYLYCTGCADDNFDWTDGWQGKAQFLVCQQYADDADQGIEADNNADQNDAAPRSNPTIYNLTLIGAKAGAPEESDVGMLLREGTAGKIYNAIVMNFGECGIDVDNEATFLNAWNSGSSSLNGNLVVDNCIFYDNIEDAKSGESDESSFPFTTDEFINTLNTNNRFANPSLTNPYDTNAPDFRPMTGSIALTGYVAPPSDGFFTPVTYVGAFNSTTNWISGWTTAAEN